MLGSVHEAMLPQAAADGVALELIAPAGCKIEADQQQLEQVFTNLVGNACKFTPAGGRVTVELAPDQEDGVLIEVSDTGMGIPEEDFDHLFTRFFRAGNAAAAALPGTGLGLAIVREIVQRHGGSVDFRLPARSGQHLRGLAAPAPAALLTAEEVAPMAEGQAYPDSELAALRS